MTTTMTNTHPTAADQLDLMPYLNILISRWWVPLVAALAFGAMIAWKAYQSPYMYESTAKASIIDIEDPGGVSPDDRRASEVLTLVEHGFVMGTTYDNYNEVMLARLRSRQFLMRFIEEENIYRFYFPKKWDSEKGEWIDGFQPDRGLVLTAFRDEVRSIDVDEETDIVHVTMKWPDAPQARDWANAYVKSFNRYMRERTLGDVQKKHEFLREELRRAEVLEIQQSIYRLIEAQTAIEMLASARDEYVLEVIDPAALPYRSFNLSRKKKVLVGTVAGLMIGIFGLFAWVFLSSAWRQIAGHRKAIPVDAEQPNAN
jgi:hypothetical protein